MSKEINMKIVEKRSSLASIYIQTEEDGFKYSNYLLKLKDEWNWYCDEDGSLVRLSDKFCDALYKLCESEMISLPSERCVRNTDLDDPNTIEMLFTEIQVHSILCSNFGDLHLKRLGEDARIDGRKSNIVKYYDDVIKQDLTGFSFTIVKCDDGIKEAQQAGVDRFKKFIKDNRDE